MTEDILLVLDQNLQEWELQWRRRFLMTTRHACKVAIDVH